jgi:hypothetical protein
MGYGGICCSITNVGKTNSTDGHTGYALARLSFDNLVDTPRVFGGDYTTLLSDIRYANGAYKLSEYQKGVTWNVEYPVNTSGIGLLPNTEYTLYLQVKKLNNNIGHFWYDLEIDSASMRHLTIDSIKASV